MENAILNEIPIRILLNILKEERIDSSYNSQGLYLKRFKRIGLIDEERKITPKGRRVAENLIKLKNILNGNPNY